MTERKPPGVSFGTWVERQIREAQRRGSFDNLPGAGEPIRGLDQPHDSFAWVAAKLHRENMPVAAILPPALALAKEVEDLPERVAALKSEAAVRQVVEDLNARITAAHRRPQEGPPLRVMPRDVDRVIAGWRERRSQPDGGPSPRS